jgi:hypothetical protein
MEGLHYLYECDGSGREKYVYYCSSCSCVLGVKRELRPVGDMIDSLEGKCPGCGGKLEGSTECRLAQVAEDWSDIDFASPGRRSGSKVDFRRASTLMPFSLGFPKLDLMVQPLKPGKLLMLSGGAAPAVAELAALRAQLSHERGGLDSTALFIDGGNCSDPYLFASFARQHGLDPRKALRRVVTCRAFTMYQLADLVQRHIIRAAEENASRLVIVADLLGTFNEPELDRREASRLLEAVKAGLDELLSKEVYVLCTLVSQSELTGLVVPWADSLVDLSPQGGMVRATLVRGVTRFGSSCEFKLSDLLKSAVVRAVAR